MRKVLVSIFAFVIAAFIGLYFLPPKVAAFSFPENAIWKHRQNNPDDAIRSVAESYQGVEIDIMFHEGILRVSHDHGELAKSVTLESYLGSLKSAGAVPHLWLDIKTMTRVFEPTIRKQLLDLSARFDLSNRLIVESPHPANMFRLCRKPISCAVWPRLANNPLTRLHYRMMINGLSRWGNVVMVSVNHPKKKKKCQRYCTSDFPKAYFTYPNRGAAKADAKKGGAVIYLTD